MLELPSQTSQFLSHFQAVGGPLTPSIPHPPSSSSNVLQASTRTPASRATVLLQPAPLSRFSDLELADSRMMCVGQAPKCCAAACYRPSGFLRLQRLTDRALEGWVYLVDTGLFEISLLIRITEQMVESKAYSIYASGESARGSDRQHGDS